MAWLIGRKPDWKEATWQFYAASASFGLEVEFARNPGSARESRQALEFLRSATLPEGLKVSQKTSAPKATRIRKDEKTRIFAALALSRSRYARSLEQFLDGALATGLRPCEWRNAEVAAPEEGFALKLVVRNAKFGNERAHGETRTLRWSAPSPEMQASVEWCVGKARSFATKEEYDCFVKALAELLRNIDRKFFEGKSHIAPSSARHEFAAMAKLIYSPAEVAALMGHAVDTTPTGYGRAKKTGSGRFASKLRAALPVPDPVEVARVKRVYDEGMRRMREGGSSEPKQAEQVQQTDAPTWTEAEDFPRPGASSIKKPFGQTEAERMEAEAAAERAKAEVRAMVERRPGFVRYKGAEPDPEENDPLKAP